MRSLTERIVNCAQRAAVASVLVAWAVSALASTEPLVVIVNPSSGVQSMSRAQVADLYMARDRTLAPGVTALPLDFAGLANEREQFYAALVGKSVAQINAYWARLIFTGRATPPQQFAGAKDVVNTVADNKSAIGYVPKSKVDSRVRIVLELAE